MTRNNQRIRLGKLTPEDAAAGLVLSKVVGWNQSHADWRLLLTMGLGFGARTPGGELVGTTLLHSIPPLAWLSMVLVHPAFRGRGIGRQLVEAALATSKGAVALDATPLGRPLYSSLGFQSSCSVHRMVRLTSDQYDSAYQGVTEISDEAMAEVLSLDQRAFGAERSPALLSLHRRLPSLSRALWKKGILQGYCLGRCGTKASQIGPVVARNGTDALRLLDSALSSRKGSVIVDALASRTEFVSGLRERGFSHSRSLDRMIRGSATAPGCGPPIFATAGPELG